MDSLDAACALLVNRKRSDLADLLTSAKVEFEAVDYGFSGEDSIIVMANAAIYAPLPAYEELRALSSEENQLIFNIILEVCESIYRRAIYPLEVSYRLAWESSDSGMVEGQASVASNFKIPHVNKLPITTSMLEIIEFRLREAQICMTNGAYLAATILWGSVLEASLLGAALNDQEKFYRSQKRPPDGKSNKPKRFSEWTLSNFIDVALDIGLLKKDIREPGRGLREFRNYIHPSKEMESEFRPDDYTARISFYVLKAALADLAGDR